MHHNAARQSWCAGHDSSESLRHPAAPGLDARLSEQGQSVDSGEEAREQASAQLARNVQEDVAKARDSLREGQAALVSPRSCCAVGLPV